MTLVLGNLAFGDGANADVTSPPNIRANTSNLHRNLSPDLESRNAVNVSSTDINIELKPLENKLMNLQMQRDKVTSFRSFPLTFFVSSKLNDDIKQLERSKIKSSANMARQKEIEGELRTLQSEISSIKYKIREINIHYWQKDY